MFPPKVLEPGFELLSQNPNFSCIICCIQRSLI